MTVKIQLARNSDEGIWNSFVLNHPSASPYHMFAWKTAVETAYSHKAYYLMAVEGEKIAGILPLIYLKPPLLSGQLVSLPYCDIGDVLATRKDAADKLVDEAILLAQELDITHLELRGSNPLPGPSVRGHPVKVQSYKVCMTLALPESSEILWRNFKSKLRSQIRKAEKNGLMFKWGDAGDLDCFYKVFSQNMRDLGSPVHSKSWFSEVLTHFAEHIRMGLVYHNDLLVGVGIVLSINDSVYIPWASTLRDFNRLSPNMLLYWNFLRYASDHGYCSFEFGRSSPNESTYKFKAQWGARPVPLHWNYVIVNNGEMNFNAADSAKRERIARLWQRLPVGVANLIGPAIRKHISL